MNLCDTIDFKLAKLLNNRVYADFTDNKYAAGDVEVTWDNYLGSGKYKEGDLINDGDTVHGKYYFAPSYAEVIDWLFEKGIVIELNPCFTFALNSNVAYFYKVYKINVDNASLELLFDDQEWFSSLELAMYNIVKKIIEDKYID